jgi:hypothetical protein
MLLTSGLSALCTRCTMSGYLPVLSSEFLSWKHDGVCTHVSSHNSVTGKELPRPRRQLKGGGLFQATPYPFHATIHLPLRRVHARSLTC